MYHFIPINGPLFHQAVSSPCYLSAFSGPIYSWAHFQHSVTYGPLLSFSACGPNSARRYSRPICGPLILWAVFMSKKPVGLFSQSYQIRPIDGPLLSTNSTTYDWRNDDTPRRRPMDPTARIEGQWILRPEEGPWIIRHAGGPWLQQSVCCHDYFGLVSKNRLLGPLEKHRKELK